MLVRRDPGAARTWIYELMRNVRYVRAAAAERLGTSSSTLRLWIAELGIGEELNRRCVAAGGVLAPERRVGTLADRGAASVYFIQCGLEGPIKIGWSTNVSERLATAQTYHHEELVLRATAPGGADVEARLHAVFQAAHIRGEWFRPVPELLELVAALDEGVTLASYLEGL